MNNKASLKVRKNGLNWKKGEATKHNERHSR